MSALEDLLDRMDAAREQTLIALEQLPDEALVQPGVIGRWSIADLLSILTAWDAEVVTGLLRLKQGKAPERLLAAVANPDLYNAGRYQDAQGRDLDVIFEDFQGSRLHLEEWLSELTERALTAPGHYKSLSGQPLGRLIARATYEHEARYLPFLRTFAERWEDQEPDTGYEIRDTSLVEAGQIIGLGEVDVLNSPNGDSAGMVFPEDDDDEFD